MSGDVRPRTACAVSACPHRISAYYAETHSGGMRVGLTYLYDAGFGTPLCHHHALERGMAFGSRCRPGVLTTPAPLSPTEQPRDESETQP